MNTVKSKPAFSLLIILLVPAFVLSLNYILFGSIYFSNAKVFLLSTLITFSITYILSKLHIAVSIRLRKRYPHITHINVRILIWVLIINPITPLFVSLLFWGYHWIHFPGYELHLSNWKWALLVGFISDIIGIIFNEGIFTFSKWQEKNLEAENLKKANIESQLETLKSQINPHFLFNSLNTLEALIDEKHENASQFVRELGNVYRFILHGQDKNLNTLKEELDFISAYFFLLKTRFGNNLTLDIAVEERHYNKQLPPLTLQLLIENAMKHNIVSSAKPLQIKISTVGENSLTVINQLQKKSQLVPSGKMGLNNIKKRYEILGQGSIQIEDTNEQFRVTVSLIDKTP